MQDIQSKIDQWVKTRPFLEEIAGLEKLILKTCHDFGKTEASSIDFEKIEAEVKKGNPLMGFLLPLIPKDRAAELFCRIAKAVSEGQGPENLSQAAKALAAKCEEDADFAPKVVSLILENDYAGIEQMVTEAGNLNLNLTAYLAWAALSHVIDPYIQEINKWLAKNDKLYRKDYCPTCGSKPAMGHLKKTKNGRQRFLSCGYCKTQWVYKRIGCPFCGSEEKSDLTILDVEDEDIRIDLCGNCHSYLKTYTDEGDEALALADWSSLHLDAICKKKGYQQKMHALYRF